MAFDCFLKIDVIPGECTDDKHKEWIEILSYSHGVSQLSSGSVSTGCAASPAGAAPGACSTKPASISSAEARIRDPDCR